MSAQLTKNEYPGKLIVMEGIEGAGKTTQLGLLASWLEAKGFAVNYTRRRTSKLVAQAIAEAKAKKTLTQVTYSLIHAADFADTLENTVVPALRAGFIVIADCYIFTSFARDVVRGNDKAWVEELYGFAVAPDGLFYLDVPVETSLKRVSAGRVQEFYDSGLDTGLHADPRECFKLFHSRIVHEFRDHVLEEYDFQRLDGCQPIHVVQRELRQKVERLLA